MAKAWSSVTKDRMSAFRQHQLDEVQVAYEPLLRRARTLGAGYFEWATERQKETMRELDAFLNGLATAKRGAETAASLAAAPSRGESIFSDTVDAEDAVLRYIDRIAVSRAEEDWYALDAILLKGEAPVSGGTFVVGQWNMLTALRNAEATLRRKAMMYVPMDYQQSIVEPAVADLTLEISRLNGATFDPHGALSGFDVFTLEVAERIQKVVERLREKLTAVVNGPHEFPEEVRYQWLYVEEVVDHAVRTYLDRDAIELYDLQVSASQATEMVRWLDEMNRYVPAKLRDRFEMVYRIVANYVRYMGRQNVAPGFFYQPEQKMTETIKAAISQALEDEWKVMMERGAPGVRLAPPSGALLEQSARGRGLSEQFLAEREAAKAALIRRIDAVKANPWSGPCAPNYDGVVVPFDAFADAEGLYVHWVRQQVRDVFAGLSEWITSTEAGEGGFRLGADYVGVVLNEWADRFEHVALGDVRFRSVHADQWEAFRGIVAGTVGVRYASAEEFEAYIDGEGERLIREGVRRVYDRLAVQETEIPAELLQYEELIRYDALRTLSDVRLNELYDSLRALELKIPPTEKALLRYENACDAFRDELDRFRGGAEYTLDFEDATGYAERQGERLKTVYGDVAALWNGLSGGTAGTAMVEMQVNAAMSQLRSECLGWTLAGGMSRGEIEEKRAASLHRLEVGLDALRNRVFDEFRERFADVLGRLKAVSGVGLDEKLKGEVEGLLRIDTAAYGSLAEFRPLQDDLRQVAGMSTIVGIGVSQDAAGVARLFAAMIREMQELERPDWTLDVKSRVETLLAVDVRLYPSDKVVNVGGSLYTLQEAKELLANLYSNFTGVPLGGAMVIRPFGHFEPLKSRAGVGAESFTDQEIDQFVENWARPRLERGLYCEPKVGGYRAVAHVRDGEVRLLLEEDPVDRSSVYVDLARELSKLPDVVLDGELIDRIGEDLAPEVMSGRYKRSEMDNAEQVLAVFDLLYLDGESLAGEALETRRKKLREFLGHRDLSYVIEWPVWYVNTESGLREALDKAAGWVGSEGAMVKVPLSTYAAGEPTPEWAKVKRTEDVLAKVLGVERTGDGRYVYECGLVYQGEKGFDKKSLRRVRGGQFVVVGKTFGTGVSAGRGQVLRVRVAKVARIPGPQGVRLEWQDPTVVEAVGEKADTVGRLLNISHTLSASITQPYRVLRDLEDKAAAAKDPGSLSALAGEVFEIFRGLNFPRLRTLAWAVYEGIERRLSEMGVKQGVVDAKVDLAAVQEQEKQFGLVESSKSLIPDEQVKRAQPILDVLVAWLRRPEVLSDNALESYVLGLSERVRTAIEAWGGAGGLSASDIERELSVLGQRAYDAVQLPVTNATRVKTAIEVRAAVTKLMGMMGRLLGRNPKYGADVSRIFEYVERILREAAAGQVPEDEVPEEVVVAYERVVSQLAYWAEWLPEIVEGLQRKDKSAYADLQSIARAIGVLEGEGTFWIDKLTPRQRAIFSAWIDELTEEIRAAMELWKTVMGGAVVPSNVEILIGNLARFVWILQSPLPELETMRVRGIEVAQRGYESTMRAVMEWAETVTEWPENPREMVREKVEELALVEAQKLVDEWKATATEDSPVPLGVVSAPREDWVSPAELWKLDMVHDPYIWEQVRDRGNSVLLRFTGEGEPRVLAVVAPDGTVVAGDPSHVVEWRAGRMLEGVMGERAAGTVLARTEAQGPEGLPPGTAEGRSMRDVRMEDVRDAVRAGAAGSVEVVTAGGGGSAYFGGMTGDGRPFFVTAQHVVEGLSVASVRLPNGRLLDCEVRWTGDEVADVAILVGPAGVDLAGLEALPLGEAAPSGEARVYGVAVSPYWGEADMVNLATMAPVGWHDSREAMQALETERWRRGYSGGPVVDMTGRVVGLASWGVPGGAGSEYGGAVPLWLLRWAYEQSGVSRLGAAEPLSDRQFMGSAPKAIPVPGELVRVTSESGEPTLVLSFAWNDGPRHEVALRLDGVEDKLLRYGGGKLVAAVNEVVSGEREIVERLLLVPSRARGNVLGDRYYEFYLTFERSGGLNGWWCLTEQGAAEYGAPFFLFRLKGTVPFWLRHRTEAEARGMPAWQKPIGVRNG